MKINSNYILSGNFFIDHLIFPKTHFVKGENHIVNANPIIKQGGIANVSRALSLLKVNHTLNYTSGSDDQQRIDDVPDGVTLINDKSVGTSDLAYIVIDTKDSTRTSFVVKGVSHLHTPPLNLKFDVHHISYLDSLPSYSNAVMKKIRANSKIISADLCLNNTTESQRKSLIRKLKFIDYLVISDTELGAYFGSDLKVAMKEVSYYCSKTIVHHQTGFSIVDNGKVITREFKIRKVNNILGAGDIYAAALVANCSDNLSLLDLAIKSFKQANRVISTGGI